MFARKISYALAIAWCYDGLFKRGINEGINIKQEFSKTHWFLTKYMLSKYHMIFPKKIDNCIKYAKIKLNWNRIKIICQGLKKLNITKFAYGTMKSFLFCSVLKISTLSYLNFYIESTFYLPALYIGRKDTRLRVYISIITYQRLKTVEKSKKSSLSFVCARVCVRVTTETCINVRAAHQKSCLSRFIAKEMFIDMKTWITLLFTKWRLIEYWLCSSHSRICNNTQSRLLLGNLVG